MEYSGQLLQFSFASVIDSGADYCMFPAQFGEKIGIPIRQGKLQSATGITGSDLAYFHAVVVYAEINGKGCKFNCYGGVMYSLDPIGLGLLGRHGFFELF